MNKTQYLRDNPYDPERWESKEQYFHFMAIATNSTFDYIKQAYYKRVNPELTVVRETYGHDGKKINEVRGLRESPESVEGFVPTRITTTPYGGQYVKYEKPEIDLNDAVETLRHLLIKEIEPYPTPHLSGDGCSLVVFSSDKHFGAHTKENSVYENPYNPQVFRERHDRLIERIYKESQRFGVFNELVYFDLGDAADGWNGKTTRGGHDLPQNLDNTGQWREYVNEHKRAFDNLVQLNVAEKIRFIGASNSNHGGDFDTILMKTLSLYLNIKYPFIDAIVTDKPFDNVNISGHNYIFGHGKDDEDMKNGFPLDLNPKVENWINDYIDQKRLDGIIHFVAGDMHQSAHNYGKRFRYRRVMSLYGSSKWIHSNFGNGRPGVSYDIIDGNQIYQIDLIL